MAYNPIAQTVPQYEDLNGAVASGYVLKAYSAGTSTPISMATDYTGGTLATSIALNSSGYPEVSGNTVIPHVDEDYKLALYPTQAAADANSGAIWTIDNLFYRASQNIDISAFSQTVLDDTTDNAWLNTLSIPLNVKHYGAVGDGVTDDSTAIDACLDAAIAAGQGTVYFPAGEYRVASVVAPAEFGNFIRITIMGEGSGVRIVVDNTTGGIHLGSNAARSPVTLRDIAIVSKVSNGGTAFSYVRSTPAGTGRQRIFQAINVIVGPYSETGAEDYGFDKYIVATGMYRPYFNNVICYNSIAATVKGTTGIDLANTWGAVVLNCRIHCLVDGTPDTAGLAVGISDIADTLEGEGGYIVNTVIIGADVAVWRERTSREPDLHINNCHMNSFVTNLYFDGVKYAFVNNNTFYGLGLSTYKDIHIVNGEAIEISGNIYRGINSADRINVHLAPTGGGLVKDIKLNDHGIQAKADYYVQIESTVDRVEINLPATISTDANVEYNSVTGASGNITISDLVNDQTPAASANVKITKPGTTINSFSGELTIATGAITVKGTNHTVDTEADAATDDLDTINGGYHGMVISLRSAASTRDPTVKDGTGNINLAGGDFVLDTVADKLWLEYDSFTSEWVQISSANNQ